MAVLAPLYAEFTAIQFHVCLAPGQTFPRRRDQHCTGSRSTGRGDTRAAFPNPHTDQFRSANLGKLDIRPVRENRVQFQFRANLGERHRLHVIDEKDGMGVAHINTAGTGIGRIRNLDRERVGLHRQRNGGGFKPCWPHIHRDAAALDPLTGQRAGNRFEIDPVCLEFLHHQIRDAACAIAAGAGLCAIRVMDAHKGVTTVLRCLNRQKLVIADTAAPVPHGAIIGGRENGTGKATVKDNEIITEAVHLQEFNLSHDGIYMLCFGQFQYAFVSATVSQIQLRE